MGSNQNGSLPCRSWMAVALHAMTAFLLCTTSHVPVRAADADKERIILSASLKEVTDIGRDLVLRPNVEQGFYVYVRNPAKVDKKMRIELLAADSSVLARSDLMSVAKESVQRVGFKSAVAPAAAAQPAGEAPLQGPPFWYLLALFDEQNKELERRKVGVTILEPPQYVEVSSIAYDPKEKKLSVDIRALPQFSGPPCPVELELLPERIPGFFKDQKRAGTYRTLLQKEKGSQASLVAEKLRFEDIDRGNGLVNVTVDGYKRAFIFETSFVRTGNVVQPKRVIGMMPSLRVLAPPASLPVASYKVCLEVDHCPHRDVEIEVGVDRANNGMFQTSLLNGDREEHVFLNPAGPEGALIFKTQVRDWCVDLDLRDIAGKRSVRVRLLDKNGPLPVLVDDQKRMEILQTVSVSDSPPEGKFLDPPSRLARGMPLDVKATASDPDAGIEAVHFFVGKPTADKKIPAEAPVVKGQQKPEGIWSARVPVPADSKSVIVGAQFVNGVGLSSFDAITVDIDEPPPKSKEAAPPSIIKGKVVRGELGQPGLEVTLTDSTGAAKGKTKTNANGEFTFKDVAPGKYKLASADPANHLKGEAEVTSEAGKTAEATIELFLRFTR